MQTLLRRLAAFGIALTALFSLSPCQARAVSTSASSAILMDVDSGRVLYEQNADAKMLIASTTKILTALVAIREGDLNDVVTVSREAAYTEGSSMYLKVGEQLTLETLLYGLLLCSGNDAAVAIAEHISGSQEKFADLMNETARDIGMEHSSFANPNGLDDEDHYSTARDMALLACAAVENGLNAAVPLVAADSFAWPLAEGETLEMDVELDGTLRAPVRAGDRAGEAVFSVNGTEVGRVALLCGADVAPRMESALSILKQGLPG